jgi:hypothetical protein
LDTRVQVGIPWRPQPSRLKAFRDVGDWYGFRGYQVIAGEHPHYADGPFNLSAARNWLARVGMTSEVMVLSDADTLVDEFALEEAIEAARVDGLVHLPYHLYRDDEGVYTPGATSGVFVFTRAAFESTNGFDPRFEGWGYEDASWRLAHLTLNGPIPRHRGVAVAMSHAPASRSQVATNRSLHKLYQNAYGNLDAMTELVKHESLKAETHQERTARRIEVDKRRRMSRPYGA